MNQFKNHEWLYDWLVREIHILLDEELEPFFDAGHELKDLEFSIPEISVRVSKKFPVV